MNAAQQRRLTPILLGLAVLLAALWLWLLTGLGSGVHWTPPRTPASLPTPTARAAAPVTTADASTPASFATVWQQSLFSPQRKPEVHGAGNGAVDGLALTGIILTPALRMALLSDGSGGHEWRLRVGQSSPDGSVTVVEVKPRAVLVDTARGRIELGLPIGASLDALPAPTATTSAPEAGTVRAVAAPVGATAQSAHPYSAQQLEALRKLKAAVQQRRAANPNAANAGVK